MTGFARTYDDLPEHFSPSPTREIPRAPGERAAYANGYEAGLLAGSIAADFVNEYQNARRKFGPMASAHEGYAVLWEEFDELWDHVKQKQSQRDHVAMRKEVVQLGAMALAFLIEVVDADNRR